MAKDKKSWRYSAEKKLLQEWLEDGTVKQDDPPKQVYAMHDGFRRFQYANFFNNFRNLKEVVEKSKGRAVFDEASFENDRHRYPPTTNSLHAYPHWPGSGAEQLLKQDLDENIDELLEPKYFHKYREEYELFPLNVFRAHIYQEQRSRNTRAYWLYRKRKEAGETMDKEKTEE